MKKEDIITLPDQRLRQKSAKVISITPEIKKLVKDMISVALDWEDSRPHEVSAALAAVQIGKMERVIIIRSNFEDKDICDFTALINPEVVKLEGNKSIDFEGCLSVPDIYGAVSRYEKVRIKAMDINGNEIRFKANGFLARTLQHEIDHINGVVFIDHIKEDSEAFYKLDEKGELQPLNYEKHIKNSDILWSEHQ